MAPKKLTEADKTSILSLYRQPQETTSTLAERYGVSNSTISRLLKSSLPEGEYSILIQQKRGASDRATVADAGGEAKPAAAGEVAADAAAAIDENPAPQPKTKPRIKKAAEALPEVAPAEPAALPIAAEQPAEEGAARVTQPLRKRRSRAAEAPEAELAEAPPAMVEAIAEALDPEPTQLSLPDPAPEKPARPVLKSAQIASPEAQPVTAAARAADDVLDDAEALDDDWDDDTVGLEDDYDDDDEGEGDDNDNVYPWDSGNGAATTNLEALEIFPLTAAALPPLCYVVVERTSSELVVLPLRTFAELGQIPEEEGDSRTLPVFENHNVARRFSRRNQRVVKVPDGSLLQTTSSYLQAKGITRLFIDGQVFSLGQEPGVPVGDD